MGDTAEGKHKAGALQGVKKLGVYLGESHHITSAWYVVAFTRDRSGLDYDTEGPCRKLTTSASGYVNILDLRMTKKPKSSVLAHPGGICKASFQSHSGLLGTIGWPEPAAASGAGTGTTIDFKLYRSQLDLLSTVTEDTIHFKAQGPDVVQEFKPYIVFHHLRPFAGINYGQHCHLRASGVGSGSTTDSGSYLFLSQQEQYKL